MTRPSSLTVGLIGAALFVSACTSTCRPAPTSGQAPTEPPTVWSLVLEVQEGGVRLIDAKPARGRIPAPQLGERIASVRSRDSLWIEYAVRSDASKQVLHSGAFSVSTTAIVESAGPDEPTGFVRVRRRFVTVAVPYVSEPASIAFTRVDPADAIPAEKWGRVPIGSAALKGVRR